MRARIHNIILYWFAPKCIEHFQEQYPDMKPITLADYEEHPENLQTYFLESSITEDKITEEFSNDIYNCLSEEAKKRFIELWNTSNAQKDPRDFYRLDRIAQLLYTEDSYTKVHFSGAKGKETLNESDLEVMHIEQAILREDANVYIAMKEYLESEFRAFFKQQT